MKRVLVIYFSQTGQLRSVAESMVRPLIVADDVEVDWQPIEPLNPYPFPWTFFDFFDQFPESVQLDPPAIKPLRAIGDQRYDIVILAYTVWFLAPSPPVTAFLKSAAAQQLLANTPVITLIACRNMWLSADQAVRGLLADMGAQHMDHVVLTDRARPLASFVTTPRWMLSGKKDAFWGVFPPAGITAEDIDGASRFGEALLLKLKTEEKIDPTQPALTGLAAVEVDPRLIASERIGRRSFEIWSRLLRRCGPQGGRFRRAVLVVYSAFLVTMIATVVPVTMLIRALIRPLSARRTEKMKTALERPSGSGREKMRGSQAAQRAGSPE